MSTELGIALKCSATCYKQKTEIFIVTRPPLAKNLILSLTTWQIKQLVERPQQIIVTMCTLLVELSNCYDIFFRLSDFLIYWQSFLLTTFKFSLLDFSTIFFARAMYKNSLISFFKILRDHNLFFAHNSSKK